MKNDGTIHKAGRPTNRALPQRMNKAGTGKLTQFVGKSIKGGKGGKASNKGKYNGFV